MAAVQQTFALVLALLQQRAYLACDVLHDPSEGLAERRGRPARRCRCCERALLVLASVREEGGVATAQGGGAVVDGKFD